MNHEHSKPRDRQEAEYICVADTPEEALALLYLKLKQHD